LAVRWVFEAELLAARRPRRGAFALVHLKAGPAEWVSGCYNGSNVLDVDDAGCARTLRGAVDDSGAPVRPAARARVPVADLPKRLAGFHVVSFARWSAYAWPDSALQTIVILLDFGGNLAEAKVLLARLEREDRYRAAIVDKNKGATAERALNVFNPGLVIGLGGPARSLVSAASLSDAAAAFEVWPSA